MTVNGLLQGISDTMRQPLLVLDSRMRVIYGNRAYYRAFQATAKETENRLIYELVEGHWDIPELRQALETILPEDAELSDFELRHLFPLIGERLLLLNARKLINDDYPAGMILLAIEDITDRRKLESSHQETLQRLNLLVDGARDYAMILLDAQGLITCWNSGAERITGWREDEVIGGSCSILRTSDDLDNDFPDHDLIKAAKSDRAEGQRWLKKKDGSLFFSEGVMTGLRDDGNRLRAFALVLRDKTEKKRADDVLKATPERDRYIAEILQRPLTLEVAENSFPGMTVVTLYEAAMDEAQVGGDFFDAFDLPEGRVAFAVGDASGKGLAAAARIIQVKEILRAFTREPPHSVDAIFSRVNDYLCNQRRYDFQEQEAFVCLTLAILQPQTGDGYVLSAGCEPPCILHGDNEAEVISFSHFPLGMYQTETFAGKPFFLDHGDILLMLTDGITEARRSRLEFLGYEGMLELTRGFRRNFTLRELGKGIIDGARTFAKNSLKDDACLLLAKRH